VTPSAAAHIFSYIESHRVAPKSKPLSNYQKIVLNRIRVCKREDISSSN